MEQIVPRHARPPGRHRHANEDHIWYVQSGRGPFLRRRRDDRGGSRGDPVWTPRRATRVQRRQPTSCASSSLRSRPDSKRSSRRSASRPELHGTPPAGWTPPVEDESAHAARYGIELLGPQPGWLPLPDGARRSFLLLRGLDIDDSCSTFGRSTEFGRTTDRMATNWGVTRCRTRSKAACSRSAPATCCARAGSARTPTTRPVTRRSPGASRRASIEGVDVSGLTIAVSAHIPENILIPKSWKAAVFVDDRSTDAQQDALLKLFTGQLGGPVADLAGLIGEVTGVERVPIGFTVEGGKGRLTLGELVEAEMTPYVGATGNPTTLAETVFSTIPGSPVYAAKASTYTPRREQARHPEREEPRGPQRAPGPLPLRGLRSKATCSRFTGPRVQTPAAPAAGWRRSARCRCRVARALALGPVGARPLPPPRRHGHRRLRARPTPRCSSSAGP